MNKENVPVEMAGNKETALAEPKTELKENAFPIFVEAEKMFDRFADLTRQTAHKAYEFFLTRGGEFGREIDDWFKAESEILRPVTVEVAENDQTINVTAAVPGFKPEEIEISVKDNLLILSGETFAENKKEEGNTVYSEWRSNRFFRQITLPAEVDAEQVKANLKDGLLQLSLPKAAPREVKQIAVTAG
jgi:HSP20 family protein